MERFLKRYNDRITGILTGFDRMLFRGSLRSISYVNGLQIFLNAQHVLLKEFAPYVERLTTALKTHAADLAQRTGRPFLYLSASRTSKEDVIRQVLRTAPVREGLVAILSCVEPCQSFTVRRDRARKQISLKPHRAKCLHLYFYYLDREWGLMHIRVQTWVPFTVQVCLNGREWLARRLTQAGIAYTQRDNCFTAIEDVGRAQRLFDSLVTRDWAPWLDRWVHQVNPLVVGPARLRLPSGYYWSLRQNEVATDVMFRTPAALQAIYPALTQHAIQQFSSPHVLRFLGRRSSSDEITSRLTQRSAGVCVRHSFEDNSIKMYDKYGSVLRIETTINHVDSFRVFRATTRKGQHHRRWSRLRKGVIDLPRRVELACAANARYLDALSVVGDPTPSHRLLDPVSQPTTHHGRPYRALRPISPDEAPVFRAILRGEFNLHAVRNADLRAQLSPTADSSDPLATRRLSGRVTRTLALLRAHGLIFKVAHTHRYRITKKGHHVMSTALRFRETDLAVLAA